MLNKWNQPILNTTLSDLNLKLYPFPVVFPQTCSLEQAQEQEGGQLGERLVEHPGEQPEVHLEGLLEAHLVASLEAGFCRERQLPWYLTDQHKGIRALIRIRFCLS